MLAVLRYPSARKSTARYVGLRIAIGFEVACMGFFLICFFLPGWWIVRTNTNGTSSGFTFGPFYFCEITDGARFSSCRNLITFICTGVSSAQSSSYCTLLSIVVISGSVTIFSSVCCCLITVTGAVKQLGARYAIAGSYVALFCSLCCWGTAVLFGILIARQDLVDAFFSSASSTLGVTFGVWLGSGVLMVAVAGLCWDCRKAANPLQIQFNSIVNDLRGQDDSVSLAALLNLPVSIPLETSTCSRSLEPTKNHDSNTASHRFRGEPSIKQLGTTAHVSDSLRGIYNCSDSIDDTSIALHHEFVMDADGRWIRVISPDSNIPIHDTAGYNSYLMMGETIGKKL